MAYGFPPRGIISLTFLAESAQHPSFNFETESTSDWDLPDSEPGSSAGGGWRGSRRSLCKALVKGLQNGQQPVKWEITFDLGPFFQSRGDKGQEEEEEEDIWNETFHHLAAKSIVQDFEQLAEREFEIEHGIWAALVFFRWFSSCPFLWGRPFSLSEVLGLPQIYIFSDRLGCFLQKKADFFLAQNWNETKLVFEHPQGESHPEVPGCLMQSRELQSANGSGVLSSPAVMGRKRIKNHAFSTWGLQNFLSSTDDGRQKDVRRLAESQLT